MITKETAQGMTLIEVLIAIAAIALIAAMFFLSIEEREQGAKNACLQQQTSVMSFETTWLATTTPADSVGDVILCRQYKAAAEAWNNQCSDYFPAFTLPKNCG